MNLMDGILLTLVNTAVCLVLPKLLSVILAKKNQEVVSPIPVQASEDENANVSSYVDVLS
jgi:hypothetical protein